jgi:hypothetical protein
VRSSSYSTPIADQDTNTNHNCANAYKMSDGTQRNYENEAPCLCQTILSKKAPRNDSVMIIEEHEEEEDEEMHMGKDRTERYAKDRLESSKQRKQQHHKLQMQRLKNEKLDRRATRRRLNNGKHNHYLHYLKELCIVMTCKAAKTTYATTNETNVASEYNSFSSYGSCYRRALSNKPHLNTCVETIKANPVEATSLLPHSPKSSSVPTHDSNKASKEENIVSDKSDPIRSNSNESDFSLLPPLKPPLIRPIEFIAEDFDYVDDVDDDEIISSDTENCCGRNAESDRMHTQHQQQQQQQQEQNSTNYAQDASNQKSNEKEGIRVLSCIRSRCPRLVKMIQEKKLQQQQQQQRDKEKLKKNDETYDNFDYEIKRVEQERYECDIEGDDGEEEEEEEDVDDYRESQNDKKLAQNQHSRKDQQHNSIPDNKSEPENKKNNQDITKCNDVHVLQRCLPYAVKACEASLFKSLSP